MNYQINQMNYEKRKLTRWSTPMKYQMNYEKENQPDEL